MIYLTDMFPIVSDIGNGAELKLVELNDQQQHLVFNTMPSGEIEQIIECKETAHGLGLDLNLSNKRVVLEKDNTVYYVQTSHRLRSEYDLPKEFFYKMLKITLR